MIRMTLQFLAGTVLVYCAFLNLHISAVRVGGLEPRAEEDVTVIENQYLPIEYWLIGNYSATKRLGFMTPRTLSGKPLDELESLRWAQLRYVMIPRILVSGTDETFVILYFKVGEHVPAVPDNLVQVFDPGTGMILYKQKTAP